MPALLCGAAALWLAEFRAEAARAERPMSAIDWLSTSVAQPTSPSQSATRPQAAQPDPVPDPAHGNGSSPFSAPTPGAPPVSPGVHTEAIAVTALDQPLVNALGLVAGARIGLPATLWGQTPEADLAKLLRKERIDTLPSIQTFLLDLLVAELDPPAVPDPGGRDVLFLARVDRLLDMGALDQAMALLDQAPHDNSEIFRRRFDIALLLGQENAACQIMAHTPNISPSFPARIFCLARRGNWQAAALTLQTGRSLGQIDPQMADLLGRFLDPEYAEASAELPPPTRPSPLVFRLMEAVGQPMATATLPVAFAQSDLQANNGWKSQIEAAERLTRADVLDPNRLLGLYTRQKASASGGVWDRVTMISGLDRALSTGKTERVTQLLPQIWQEMQEQELEPAVAAMFSDRLQKLHLEGEAGQIAFRLGLLTPAFATVAAARAPVDADEALQIALAKGDTAATPAQDRMGLMLKRVFDAQPQQLPDRYRMLMPNREGEALLNAIDDITEGARGDLNRVQTGLTVLRMTGFETLARRTALELVVLERNG